MNAYAVVVTLHVLGATIWTGGHLVLSHTVLPRALKANDPKIVQDFEAGFEKIGIPALILQVLTGAHLAATHLPGVGTWLDTSNPVARLVLAKLGLLLATVLLAAHARIAIVPKITKENLRPLAWHIRIVTALAVGFVILGVAIRSGGL